MAEQELAETNEAMTAEIAAAAVAADIDTINSERLNEFDTTAAATQEYSELNLHLKKKQIQSQKL